MKKQKVISAIVSVAAAFGGLGIVPVSAAGTNPIHQNHTFIDIAHNGNTFVAMTKNADYTAAKLYTSTDGGQNWIETMTSISPASITNNKQSQQQLVYWEDEGVFVAHGAGTTYTSADGTTWTENSEIHWTENTYLTTSGEYLILSGGSNDSALSAQDNLTAKQYGANKFQLNPTAYIPRSVAATPKDDNGDIYVLAMGQMFSYYAKMTPNPGGSCKWELVKNPSGGIIPSEVYDMTYAEGAEQFLAVTGGGNLFTIANGDTFREYTLKAGTTVTGIGASDKYIVAGLSDGTMLYTENAPISEATQWTEIPAAEGKTACTEAIKNIEFADNGEDFVALSDKHIYIGDTSGYTENTEYEYVPEYRDISNPYVTTDAQENPFEGVRLIGGAYSPTLGKYIVYGDTTEKLPNEDGVESYWGMIFTSDDGLTWERVYQGYTFSQRNMDKEDTNKVASYTEVRNGAVWWENEGIFIISASTMDHTGVSLVSSDGENWSAVLTQGNTDAEGNPTPEKDTGLPLNVDIALGGDGNLYVGGSGRRVWKYMAWNIESREETLLTDVISGQWYLNQLSVSDEADPAILTYQNAEGAVKDNDSGTWTAMANIASGGLLTDSVYSGSLNSFVAVSGSGHRTSIVSKDGSVAQGPVVPGGVVCKAIDTNDEVFMLAGQDGNVYTAADTAEFASSSLTAVASANGSTNTMPLTNVFKAGEMFIATASDNTDSDVLAISKNAETGSYEYVTASSLIGPGEMAPGSTVNVCVDVDNQLNEVCTFTLISAVFSPDKRCVQINTYDASVGERVKETVTMPVEIGADVPEGSTMRLFVWDSLEGMVPLTDVSVPFN